MPHTALSVNVNKVALLRNSRHLNLPNVKHAAHKCLAAGAAGITVHPRPDARHIRPSDVAELAEMLQAWPQAEFNIEGNPLHNLMPYVEGTQPAQATFVPDAREQFTSDHGWLLDEADRAALIPLITRCKLMGVRVSLFMDADAALMRQAWDVGADRVELYTEPYARAFDDAFIFYSRNPRDFAHALSSPTEVAQNAHLQHLCQVLDYYREAAAAAADAGLGVNAGHDLNAHNLPLFLARVPQVVEVSIGHAFIADALERGYEATVAMYLDSIRRGNAGEIV